ncbi:hypothetical protein BH10PSE5_BH10PSE5_19220 [soil metagenome]
MTIRTALLAISLGASVSPAFAQGEGEAVASESGPYAVTSALNGSCLNGKGGVLKAGGLLVSAPCQGAAHSKRFYMRPMPDGANMLIVSSPGTNLCVDAPAAPGKQLRLGNCRPDADRQSWSIDRGRLLATRGGYCAHLESGAQGARVVSGTCGGGVNERWRLNRIG